MKTFSFTPLSFKRIVLTVILFIPVFLLAAGDWPKEVKTTKSDVIIYQLEPDSMRGDHLYSRAAISFTSAKYPTPVFGAIWSDSRFSTDRESGTITVFDVKILNVRFPGVDTIDPAKVEHFKQILSEQATSWNLEYSLDELKSTLTSNQVASATAAKFNNDPPEIIYVKYYSVLLLFDGDPVFNTTGTPGISRATNTPFLVLQDMNTNSYYLFGANFWYKSSDPLKGPWYNITNPPDNIVSYFNELSKQVDYSGNSTQTPATSQPAINSTAIPQIIVRTRPAELIQSDGEPLFAPIQGTQLLYMTNTDDNIFMTIDNNQYYILISGRWYRALALAGPWQYVDSDSLPPDFAKIPEGSDKDVVLASIAGTPAAKDAVMDAQIPQTAAVDRKTAQCDVEYDGDPKFEKIRGTDLSRAINTSSTVLLYQNTFYVCDNGVWFVGPGPDGPWQVATSIPDEIQLIPPDDPDYNVRFVYIYDVEPDVVYIGYTPGYTGCYIYGNTVIYGTGWIYSPFWGSYYYPRPYTWGFHMYYNPWYGWCMGYSMSRGWFHYSFGERMHRHGGWWGPPLYRPPYHPRYDHYYGAKRPVYRTGGNTPAASNTRTNIYGKRTDNSIRQTRQAGPPQPGTTGSKGNQPPSNDKTRPGKSVNSNEIKPATRNTGQKNNVFTDKKGDVYRKENGKWQRSNGQEWNTVTPVEKAKLENQTDKQAKTKPEQTRQEQIKPEEQQKQQVKTEPQQPKQQQVRTEPRPAPQQQSKPAEQPRPQVRNVPSQPQQQQRSSSFNRQELENQNSARERGVQNMNNRVAVQQSSPSGGGNAPRGSTNEGKKR